MGRGRAKAKQTKVARELKYSAPNMDLSRLQRDLHSDTPFSPQQWDDDSQSSDDDPYGRYADEEEDESTAGSAAS